MPYLTESDWKFYEEQGYLKLGKVLSDADLVALQDRIDGIMMGTAPVDFDKLLMQLDGASGKYEDLPGQTNGWKGATLAYRKIQNLEHDPVFCAYMERPLFKEITDKVHGPEMPVACFRAMFMNK